MSEDDELAREEAYIAKITAKKNQAFEKKVFGGGLEAARTGGGSNKFGGGLEAARTNAGTGGSAKFGGGLEAARAAAGISSGGSTVGRTPELRGGLEAARAASGMSTQPISTPVSQPAYTPPPVYSTPAPVYSAPTPVVSTPPVSLPPLQSEVVELTMDLPPPPFVPVKQSSGSFTEARRDEKGLLSDVDAAAAREEARIGKIVGASLTPHHTVHVATPPQSGFGHAPTPVHHAPPQQTSTPAPVQPKAFQDWEKPPLQAQCGTKFESMVFAEMLSARMNPASLITALEQRKQYYSGTEYRNPHTNIVLGTQEGVRAVDDAINFLRTQSPLGSSKLVLEDGLSQSARDFCIIQKSMNTSETDEQANERLTRYGDFHGELMQNVAFVSNITSEDLVLEWIIDDGNGPRGRPHRHAIFSAKAHALGIASGPHHVGRIVCALFAEGYTPRGAQSHHAPSGAAHQQAAPVHQPAAAPASTEKFPDFLVGQLEQVDNNSANVLPISKLGCSKNDLSVALRQNGSQVEFRRNITREGRLFNLPYQVTAATCSATYNPHENGGTLRIRLGKPQARPAAGSSSEFEVCQYTIRGDPSSVQQRVQIQVKQDNPDFYEFIPGLPSPWDTTFTVVVKETALTFQGTFQQPDGQNTKVINSTQTVNLPVPPPPSQVEAVDLGNGGKAVRVWHKPRPGQVTAAAAQVSQPDCDVIIVAV